MSLFFGNFIFFSVELNATPHPTPAVIVTPNGPNQLRLGYSDMLVEPIKTENSTVIIVSLRFSKNLFFLYISLLQHKNMNLCL